MSNPLVMKIAVHVGKTTISGRMDCNDDEATLPEMIHTFLKRASQEHRELREAKSLKIDARIVQPLPQEEVPAILNTPVKP